MSRARQPYLIVARRGFGLGDIVLVTALVRDVATLHPGEFDLAVDTNFRPVWANNPHASVRAAPEPGGPRRVPVVVNYAHAIRETQQGVQRHFLTAFYKSFEQQTGVRVYPTRPSGDLHLSEAEKVPRVNGRYWVILAGGKTDMTVKIWQHRKYQAVVDRLREHGVHCVQAGSANRNHVHEPLDGCLNLVGRTGDIRDFLSLVYHADGVICGVTSGMHVAACFDKPCVVIAGGREEPHFVAYANAYPEAFGPRCPPVRVEHKFLHTVGLLDCCREKGCWKKRVVPIDFKDGTPKGKAKLCLDVVEDDSRPAPRCLKLIEPEHVVKAVMQYYEESVIPPIEPLAAASQPPSLCEGKGCEPLPPAAPRVTAEPPTVVAKLESPVRHPVYDHPAVGGKFTAFVLCYGDHAGLARRCVDSILHSVPIDRIDLRVACNAVVPETLRYLENQPISKLYVYKDNRYKYPVMRDVFRDPAAPIETPYLVWFDDDSHVADPKWMEKLGQAVVANHRHGCRLYGWKHFHDLRMYCKGGHDPRQWFWDAPWCKDKRLRVRGTDRLAPNGTCVDFVVGSFWALATHLVEESDIPDTRIRHNAGDVTIGAQVTQAGFKICNFNQNKKVILCSNAPRRGYSESFPWANTQARKQLPS